MPQWPEDTAHSSLYCGIPTVVRLPRRCCTDRVKPLQICFLSAATGKAFTTVFAGFAFTLVSLPKIILVHAFVAGLVLVLMRQRPGTANTPVFLTSFAATVTRLFKIFEQSLVFMSCSVATDFNAFMGAIMKRSELERQR